MIITFYFRKEKENKKKPKKRYCEICDAYFSDLETVSFCILYLYAHFILLIFCFIACIIFKIVEFDMRIMVDSFLKNLCVIYK